MTTRKEYDRAYFDRWYRRPSTRVMPSDAIERKVRLVVGAAEFLLQRPIRTVLDIGCGEGAWYPSLRRLRPRVRYVGVDASEYAVRRFGRRRNIRLGDFASLPGMRLPGKQDVIICADVLQYIPDAPLLRGLRRLQRLLSGIAYLEAYTADDDMEGDKDGWIVRSPEFFRRTFRDTGFAACGMHCYAGRMLRRSVLAMERC